MFRKLLAKSIFGLIVLLSLMLIGNSVSAQMSYGGKPWTFSTKKGGPTSFIKVEYDEITLKAPNVELLIAEDSVNASKDKIPRIGVDIDVDISMETAGTWTELPMGARLWTLKVTVPGAKALNLGFENFHLAEGCKLFFYNENRKQVIGAFTSENNPKDGIWGIEVIQGENLYVEYYEPAYKKSGNVDKTTFHIFSVGYFYRDLPHLRYYEEMHTKSTGWHSSGSCEVDVNCSPVGDNWQDEKRGVAEIYLVSNNQWGWCTGTLVNNTSNDGTPYFLTAYHCGEGETSSSEYSRWEFYFKYEVPANQASGSGTSTNISEPSYKTLTGCTEKASGSNKALYVTSGHWDHYGKDSFQPITTPEEGEMYLLKPMNCPHHCMIFKNSPRSYKDLPLRIAEFGTVYRYEQSGELHGLTRVRSFTQDDAHIFCRQDQVKEEFIRVMEIIEIIFKALDFKNFEAQISLRDPNNTTKYVGSDEVWAMAEQAIIDACKEKNLPARVEYGEAAFYGPKLDFMVKDAIGRRWQLGTIQVDYNLPERFELEYVGEDNKKHRPVMIHRAPFGSMERFVAVLIEHTAGKFPIWLAPNQFVVLPISEKFNDYAHEVVNKLKDLNVNGIIDERNEKIGRKIRDNELKRIPYLLIVGEKEQENVAMGKPADTLFILPILSLCPPHLVCGI